MLFSCFVTPWGRSDSCATKGKNLDVEHIHRLESASTRPPIRWKRVLSLSSKRLTSLSMNRRRSPEEEYDKSYMEKVEEERAGVRRKMEEDYERGSSAMSSTSTSSSSTMLWQRTILKGERCVPPQFSGIIFYDEYGNPLEEFNASPSPSSHGGRTSKAPNRAFSR